LHLKLSRSSLTIASGRIVKAMSQPARRSLVAAPPVPAREATPEFLHGIVLQLRGDRL
jgi:hypothetical protein